MAAFHQNGSVFAMQCVKMLLCGLFMCNYLALLCNSEALLAIKKILIHLIIYVIEHNELNNEFVPHVCPFLSQNLQGTLKLIPKTSL